jgi:hypothetical protein
MSGKHCSCKVKKHELKRIVLTGGPGAGKTAILETMRNKFCKHVAILPEAAGIIFGGGFWRHQNLPSKKAAQRAIYHVQKEMETLVDEENNYVVALCDRGTLDGLAYWPENENTFWQEIGSSREQELSRYSVIIHLRVPKLGNGYNRSNPLRIEDEEQALAIDEKIMLAWAGHPHRIFIDSEKEFLEKIARATEILDNQIPGCCKVNGTNIA